MKRDVLFSSGTLLATVLTVLATSLGAQTYPVKPIKTIVTVAIGRGALHRLVTN